MRTSWFVLAFSLFLDLGKQGIQGSQSKFAAAGNVVRSSTSRSSPLSGEGQSGTQVQRGQRGSRGVWAASSSEENEERAPSSGFHEKTLDSVRRPGAACSGPSEPRPRASPVPPRGSPVFHNASLATSRPLPSVARSPSAAERGELPRQQEFKATLKPQQPLPPTERRRFTRSAPTSGVGGDAVK